MARIQAGFYDDGQGRKRWWDGKAWTDQYESSASTEGASAPLFVFVSHIEGFNAKVFIWPDRIEWEKNAVNSAKVKAAVFTGGASLLLTKGVRTKNTDMIPIRMITGVTSKKGAGFNTVVNIRTGAGLVEFRANHGDAIAAMDLIKKLMLAANTVTVKVAAPVAPATAPEVPDIPAQLHQLKSLFDAGVLTEDEYSTKKAELLARM